MDKTILIYNLSYASSIKNMIEIVKTFERFLEQNINLQIMGINISTKIIKDLTNKYDCKKGEWSNMYLGLPLNGDNYPTTFGIPLLK